MHSKVWATLLLIDRSAGHIVPLGSRIHSIFLFSGLRQNLADRGSLQDLAFGQRVMDTSEQRYVMCAWREGSRGESIPSREDPWNKGTERLVSSWSLATEKREILYSQQRGGPVLAGRASSLFLWVMGSYQSCGQGQGSPRLISLPVTDVLNMLPQASSQVRVVSLCPFHESGSLQRDGEDIYIYIYFLSYCSRNTPNICRGLERGKGTELGAT